MRTMELLDTAQGPVTIIHDAALVDVEAYDLSPGLVGLMRSPIVRRKVLRNLVADPAVEDEILLAFLWPSAWDVQHVGLQPTSYRAMLSAVGAEHGFRPVGTDEPEIARGGGLIPRTGRRVPADAVTAFDGARYLGRTASPVAA